MSRKSRATAGREPPAAKGAAPIRARRSRNAWIALVPNRRLVRAIEQYADHMMRIRALTLGDQKVRTIVIKGLKRIAEALAAGNGDDAATAMRDHLGEAKRCFIAATGLDKEP